MAALTLGVLAIVGTGGVFPEALTGTLAVGALAAFAWRERTARTPLVPLRILGVPGVAAANLVQVAMIAGFFGLRPVEVGLGMLPIALAIGVASLGAAAPLIARIGARRVLLLGLLLAPVALLVLARLPADGSYAGDLLPALIGVGVGGGLAMPALTTVAMAAAAPQDAGLASGLFNTTQQLGAAVGLAVLAAVAAARTDALTAGGSGPAQALVGGYGVAFAAAAAAVGLALVLAVVLLRDD